MKVWFLVLMVGLSGLATAIWMRPNEMPVERVQENLEKRVAANPKDAQAVYLLARLHSYRFAFPKSTIWLYEEDGGLVFPTFDDIKYLPEGERAARVGHLVKGLELYEAAVSLDKGHRLARLGRAWTTEQAADLAKSLPAVKGVATKGQTWRWWFERALGQYRELYALAKAADLAEDSLMHGMMNHVPSYEAAQRILVIVEAKKVGSFRRGEKADLEATIKAIDEKPKMITPIVVPLGADDPGLLIDSGSSVRFDLLGDGIVRRKGWVTASAGLLCWDPSGSGRITSGQQLFGTGTFWMFFGNGFDAMAALDDDGDGWLKGSELEGVCLWHDADGDGVSDAREVRPVREWGILALRCGGYGPGSLGLEVERGVVWRDGRVTRLYDWVTSGS